MKKSIIFLLLSLYSTAYAGLTPNDKLQTVYNDLAKLESSSGGRIGVYAINTANNLRIQYRAKERFPFQSTFKVMGVAAILKTSMTNHKLLEEKISFTKEDLVYWSPVTEKHLSDGMTVSELCRATLIYSDNTAINLLMKKLGGPETVTAFARSIDDNTFILENREPELNSNPDRLSDTSTPKAMATSLQKLALGNILAPEQREQLLDWMKANTTGNSRIRAGVPKDWIVGDKTGTGGAYGVTNDIAILWPPGAPPVIVAIYFSTKNKNDTKQYNDVITSATRILLSALSG